MRYSPFVILLATCCACQGQSISVGVKAGASTLGDISSASNSATSESKRYIVGPMLEVGLPFGLGVEVDALYRREGYRSVFGSLAGIAYTRERANTWEIPILLKYKLPLPILKPYAAAGVVPRTMNGSTDSSGSSGASINVPTGQTTPGIGNRGAGLSNSVGIVAGAGVQLGVGRFRMSPEVRYTYWTSTPIEDAGPHGFEFHSSQNHVDVLVGFTWKVL